MKSRFHFRACIVFLFLPYVVFTQQIDKPFIFPDIPGYQTLVCDFHMHTVFSDGLVWPTVRIDEAIADGLDAISITDHIEYQSHSEYISGDHNSSYEIAKPYADKKGLILIRGAEITKAMPPGHFNMIFINDANALDVPEWQASLRIANDQGAFVFWNHPGWRQTDEIPIWYAEHTEVLKNGWIQGIEIVNENSYYPLTFQWAIDSNLTIVGNSDIHDPIDLFFDKCEGEHRPVTLVFVEERSENGIREALNNRRTAVYYNNSLLGDQKYLKELFYKMTSFWEILSQPAIDSSQTTPVPSTYSSCLSNESLIPIEIAYKGKNGKEYPSIIVLEKTFPLEYPDNDSDGTWLIKNFLIAPGECLELDYLW